MLEAHKDSDCTHAQDGSSKSVAGGSGKGARGELAASEFGSCWWKPILCFSYCGCLRLGNVSCIVCASVHTYLSMPDAA